MAIAYDNSQRTAFSAGAVASITTAAYTLGAGNNMLFGASFQDQAYQSDNATTATYNGNSMTKVVTQAGSGAGFTGGMAIFVIINQSSGATMTINFSPNTRAGCHIASFTGANQSTTMDSTASGAPTTGNLTATTTVVDASNVMLYLAAIDDGGAAVTGGTNTTVPIAGASGDNSAYSTSLVTSGSQSLVLNSANNRWTYGIVSIASVATPSAFGRQRRLMGIGA